MTIRMSEATEFFSISVAVSGTVACRSRLSYLKNKRLKYVLHILLTENRFQFSPTLLLTDGISALFEPWLVTDIKRFSLVLATTLGPHSLTLLW